ncbi:PAS domain S-box-containing protein [Clostridium tetanomorphum]|uniref:sensor histidine kinase n=1 Tax=Clostridium tetanomorphum TaxID=1553 RepID=UPI0004477608|nr:HAMP domain-containing sensor histidine kinase [Clostridium tetanomorphum]KAJ50326.1 PAS/PAC sensor signal transduction histidine kinase [Clostridium tetanomorphum DSM 665]MBP1866061.1 PAS domain S-box-containing protein [Clostridium tetanomorphum]NRS83260.1 PAS domain S-box-containing protein [Clostridium tetanomorphum]SQC01307.1 PAS/PAC sensor signal transduction histidine kinase [Clostridium tetanomorphum]
MLILDDNNTNYDVKNYKLSDKNNSALFHKLNYKYKNENFVKILLENIPLGVLLLDNNFNILICNSHIEHITGIKKKSLLNNNLLLFFPFFNEEFYFVQSFNFKESKLNNNNFNSTTYHIFKNKNGENKKIENTFFPIYYNNSYCILFIIKDISKTMYIKDLKRRFNKKNLSIKKMEQVDKVKTDFFTNIIHELKTPINVILAAVQLLNMDINHNVDLCESKKRDYYNSIYQNSLRLIKIINNLIDITKIDSGYFKLNLGNHNIVSIIEEITLSVANYIEDKSISLIFDTDIEEKIMACNPDIIERIILNLISNSAKFTNSGGKIIVSVQDKKNFVQISVKDNGTGIPKDELNKIFNRFLQVDKSLYRNKEGSGIGLSLVKSLVQLHGGTIKVISEYGSGTDMLINLPVNLVNKNNTLSKSKHLTKTSVEKINIEFSDIYK